ncbi:MAG: molybdopterin oxidoreductase [Ignavibacteria bacterium RBG_16_34_14]|nr:MAG: molybdopterin oxidoreductase [Ignavibacteria bacterium RBG_16_34_14]
MTDIKEGLNNPENSGLKTQPTYWKSLKQLYNDPEFTEASHHEFKEGVTDDFEVSKLSGLSRRKFLALIGASAALAGAGCSNYRDKGSIIPYNKKPEEIIPGNANYYASFVNSCKCGCGVLIKTREGRPIKVDGNPDHPVSKGKICVKCHASILSLYDPERLSEPVKKSGKNFQKISWNIADSEIRNVFSSIGDKEIAVITHSITSPTTLKVLKNFTNRYPSTKIYSYELFNDELRNSAWRKCYGSGTFPLINWDKAKIILSLEGDFLGTEGNHLENSQLFVKGRDINNPGNFSRLYVVEGNMSLAGMNADYRLRLRPDAQFEFVMSLINEISKKTGYSQIGNYLLPSFAQKYSLSKEVLEHLINDLIDSRGTSIVYAGDTLPEKVHIAVNYLNEILGNKNLYRNEVNVFLYPLSTTNDFKNLISSINDGRVGAVIHFDSNPVYHLPYDLGYSNALKKVETVISLVELENESSVAGKYTLPINHSFECWGDAKTRTGFYLMQQPVISPIHNTRQKEAVFLTWIENEGFEYKENLYHEYLISNWRENIYPTLNAGLPFEQFWLGALHDGVVSINENVATIGSFNTAVLSELNLTTDVSGFAVILKESCTIGDGRFANNGWLQELPHPVTKVTWDNYAAISQTTAKELGVDYNDFIEIEIAGRKVKIPVFIQPGAADKTITIELGYGRTHTGTVGKDVGFNANTLLSSTFNLSPYLYTSAKVTKAGGSFEIVTSQEHHSFDDELIKDAAEKRGIVKEGTIQEYLNNRQFLNEGKEHSLLTMYPDHPYTGLKWGMAIDLNKCISCGQCVVACTSENNIPVVGKDQVKRGREMHWIRVDRYYSGSIDEPMVSNQVMLCQHCDNAPCENVCPVVATTHSPDGLNQMVYNRCVGTRYCSNNCPYKVRRFNYYNFRDHFDDAYQLDNLFNLVYNPEVTVRSRGVMEKCTFCIQRIMESRETAIKENSELKGSDVKTACQEACPTSAIIFGDINDKESEISKYRNHELGYHVLEELNVRPNVTYLAKLRNTKEKA